MFAVENETDRDDVGLAEFVCRGEMGDASVTNEPLVVLIQCKMQSAN